MCFRTDELHKIYEAFESEASPYRKKAACARGCAYCCKEAGSIDITTMEGRIIRDRIGKMPRPRRTGIRKALNRDMKQREAGRITACPFLMKNRSCMIYPDRPFACRRIYSLQPCSGDRPPLLSRRVMELAQKTITALQRLDENGYSGHISFVLHMLDAPRFLETYLAGDLKPAEVMAFGKTHRIAVNRMVV